MVDFFKALKCYDYCPDTFYLKTYEIGIPMDIGPDNINQTNRNPEVFRERKFRNSQFAKRYNYFSLRSLRLCGELSFLQIAEKEGEFFFG